MSFSFDRMIKMMVVNWKLNSMSYLLEILTMIMLFVLCLIIKAPNLSYLFSFIACVYGAAQTFTVYKKSQYSLILNIPVNPSEKFFAAWLQVLLVRPLFLTMMFLGIKLIYQVSYKSMAFQKFIDLPGYVFLNKFTFFFMLVFGVGSILFKRMSTLKTVLCVSLFFFANILLVYIFAKMHPDIAKRWGKTFYTKAVSSYEENIKEDYEDDDTEEVVEDMKGVFGGLNIQGVPEFKLKSAELKSFLSQLSYVFSYLFMANLFLVSWFCFREHELKA